LRVFLSQRSHSDRDLSYLFLFPRSRDLRARPSFPTRRSSDLTLTSAVIGRAAAEEISMVSLMPPGVTVRVRSMRTVGSMESPSRSEEHTSELQSRENLVCRLLLEKKKDGADPREIGSARHGRA